MFRTLVVPLDTSPLSEQAAVTAAAIARSANAAVHLVHVFEPTMPPLGGGALVDERILSLERKQYERHLTLMAEKLVQQFGCAVDVAILSGVPAVEIAAYARRERADLIVASTHGRTGLSRAWFGSVADRLVRESAVPVLLVRPADDEPAPMDAASPPFRRIMIALDGSDASEHVLADVKALEGLESAEVLLAEVVTPVSMPVIDYSDSGIVTPMAPDVAATELEVARAKKYLGGIARRLGREGAASVETTVVVEPTAAPAIVDLAKLFRADLVALTSHGRGASRLVIGSVADKVLRGTHCPILLHRAPAGGKSPARRTVTKKRALASKRA